MTPEYQRKVNDALLKVALERGEGIESLVELQEELLAPPIKPKIDNPYSFEPFSFDDVLNMPPKKFLLDQIFGRGDIGMLYGPSGVGKTFVIIDLIMKLCTGKRWAQRFEVDRPLNVAYCAGEGYGGIPSRIKTAAANYNIETIPNFTYFKSVPQLFNKESPKHASQFVAMWHYLISKGLAMPLDFLIIDTLHNAIGGADENSSDDMHVIFTACQMIAQSLDCSILVIHHSNKEGTSSRGSNAFNCDCDFVLKIGKAKIGGTNSIMEAEKIKDGEYFKNCNFNLSQLDGYDSAYVTWEVVESDETMQNRTKEFYFDKILTILKENPEEKFLAKDIAAAIPLDLKKTTWFLSLLHKAGQCQREFANTKNPKNNSKPLVYFHKKNVMDV